MSNTESKKKIIAPKAALLKSSASHYIMDSMQVYGSYSVGERALADRRDGCKPVQRRILWTMWEMGATPDKAHRKSAKITGDTMGSYHPHGDVAIYGALVTMVHDRYSLIDKQGNFGDIKSPPASHRYTEARLSKFGKANLEDYQVVKYVKNYSGDKDEPLYLPARVPLLLANGSAGIAVGISANIPPHNLGELIRATIKLIKRPNSSIKRLLRIIKGPDYGRGVIISSNEEIRNLYETGRGTIKYRCEYELGKASDGTPTFTLRSIAPGFSLQRFLEKCAEMKATGLIEDAKDYTKDDEDIRVTIRYKDSRVLKERIISAIHSNETYQFWTVQRDGGDKLSSETLQFCNLKDMLQKFIDFRRMIETRRIKRLRKLAQHELKKNKALLAAILNLDLVFKILKANYEDNGELTKAMAKALDIDEESANFVLETKTRRLNRMVVPDQEKKIAELEAEIESYNKDLADVDAVVIRRLLEMKEFVDERKTKIRAEAEQITSGTTKGYVAARANGQIFKIGPKPPTSNGTKPYDFVCKVNDRAMAICANNTARNFWLAYSTEERYKSIIGLAKDTDEFVTVIDESGRGLSYKADIKKEDITVLKNPSGKLVSATGVGKTDKLLMISEKSGRGYILDHDQCKVKSKPKVLAYQLLAGERETISKVIRLPDGATIMNGKKTIKIKKDQTFDFNPNQNIFVIGKRNYAAIGGKVGIYDQEQTMDAIAEGKCKNVTAI